MATKATSRKSTTAAKKSPAKASVKSSPVVEKKVSEPVVKPTLPTAKAPFKVKKSYVFLILAIIVAGGLLYYFRSLFVAAVVNGQPVSRLEIVNEAEKQSGKQALNTQVRNILIEQEAKKQKVTVNDKEIEDEIKKVEGTLSQQGQKLDQVLKLQGMTKEDLRKLIRLDKLVGKMVGKDIKVSDKEINDYIEQNKEMLPQDQDEAETKKLVADRLKQQQLNDKVKTWLENLQKNANILYFVEY